MKLPHHFWLVMTLPLQAVLAQGALGVFEAHGDVGAVKHTESVVYDQTGQTYNIKGSGANLWFDQDEFHWARAPSMSRPGLRTVNTSPL